ncbi:MAG TPA: DUF6457 domain-containing protein [Mycobacteriales bacterium]|nr:DUF6457 domain-containing protein [Mycobacteriales bacterium]
MTLDEWVQAVCLELDLGAVDTGAVLDLARDVAHGVARPAAPVTCLLVGLAATGAEDLDAVIDRVRALLPES